MMASLVRRVLPCVMLGLAYFTTAAVSLTVGRLDGGVTFIWLGNALLVSRLAMLPGRQWVPPLIVCTIASTAATTLFGYGALMAPPMAVANVAEAVLGAWLLRHFNGHDPSLTSLRWVITFVLGLGFLAPLVSALIAMIAVAWIADQDSVVMGVRWFLAHALGTITFAPILMLLIEMPARDWGASLRGGRSGEPLFLMSLVLATVVLVFAQNELPLLFLPTLPVILATFRLGRLGAAASIVILAVVGSLCTLHGTGPITLAGGTIGVRMQVLQFYLAATVMTILPVAAQLAHRNDLFRKLQESEARYRLVADNSTDIIFHVGLDGVIQMVSASVQQMGGRATGDVIGTRALDLIVPDDRAVVTEAFRDVLRCPDNVVIVEYRVDLGDGQEGWYESHTRAVRDEHGAVRSVVSAVRDIAHRKAMEGELVIAAFTDPLTNLPNRRAFMGELERHARRGRAAGCVAMLDLDHFKRINDVYGHGAGDEVLRRFARVARGCLREGDMVARIGGEEFAVMLPGSSLQQAEHVCDRIRSAVEAMPVSYNGVALVVTVSGGVACWLPGADHETTLREADIALYRAKREGRNRLAMAS